MTLFGLLVAAVALQAPGDDLGERMVVYLLDENLVLVPAGHPAAVSLEIEEVSGQLVARATGHEVAIQTVDAEPHAVAELEILQRAIIAVERAGQGNRRHTVPVVHLVASSTLSASQRGRLGLAVLDGGFGVSLSATEASLSLTAEASAEGVDVCAVRASRQTESSCDGTTVHLRNGERWTDALRAVLRDALIAGVSELYPEPSRVHLGVNASAGVVGRFPSVDPVVAVDATISRGAIGARIGVRIIEASDVSVSAREVIAVIGPALALPLTEDLWLSASVGAGFLVHSYDLTDPTANAAAGTHVDFTGQGTVALSYRLGAGLAASLSIEPGIAARDRAHLRLEDVLWARTAARLGVTLGIQYDALD